MSQAVNRILEEALSLSPEEQMRLREAFDARLETTESQQQAAAKKLFGQYAHAPTSSAEFSVRKAAEMLWEEHS